MSPVIGSLPQELFLEVTSYLPHHDLTRLMRVSRQWHAAVEPLIWNKIELHRPMFHEDYTHKELATGEEALKRPYHALGPDFPSDWLSKKCTHGIENPLWARRRHFDFYHDRKSEKFISLFQDYLRTNKSRADYLAGLTRWLCIPLEVHSSKANGDPSLSFRYTLRKPWHTIAMFVNLRYLEVTAGWGSCNQFETPFAEGMYPIPKLDTLKLRGYVPRDFARHMCQRGSTITELQLAILDAPVGGVDMSEEGPTIPDELPFPCSSRRQNPPPESQSGEGDSDQEIEDFEQAAIAPRALPILTPGITSGFSNLTRLYLCMPVKCNWPAEYSTSEIWSSAKSEREILHEWSALLRHCRNTLVHITLEQRPVCHNIRPVTYKDLTHPIYIWHHDLICPYSQWPKHTAFENHVIPVLTDEQGWPALRTLRLFGFGVESDRIHHWYSTYSNYLLVNPIVPSELLSVLSTRFPNLNIEAHLGRPMFFDVASGERVGGGDVFDSFLMFVDYEGNEACCDFSKKVAKYK